MVSLDTFLTAEELAEKLQIKATTIERWVKDKKIPFYRITAGEVRFNEPEIVDWIMAGGAQKRKEEQQAQ